ncbi:MAG TPA: hypothetical protein VF622_08515 [Segetibacter sp.]|jgi:hypothetical protein
MDTNDNNNAAYKNPNNPQPNDAPPDPSNTSHIGQKVEQGVVGKHDGISEQSSAWEDRQERNVPGESLINENAERYIKDPSPEEKNNEDDEADADKLMDGPNNAGKPNTPDNNPAL